MNALIGCTAQSPRSINGNATGKAPLAPPSREGFWGRVNPFARKKYVQRQTEPIRDRVNELDELTSTNSKNIKDTGITIYTIQVNTDGDPLSTLLQNCATTGKFTMLTTASQIVTTFNQIGTQLSQLRIAQ